jgi:hypothetical protein
VFGNVPTKFAYLAHLDILGVSVMNPKTHDLKKFCGAIAISVMYCVSKTGYLDISNNGQGNHYFGKIDDFTV